MESVNEMDRIAKVKENHEKGYNCAQAVACAYCDLYGVSEAEAFRAMEAFGGGMGVMTTCGAVSAMAYLAGLKNSSGDLSGKESTKGMTYKLMRRMVTDFVFKNKSIICKELKGVDTGKPLRSCEGCMEDAARAIEKVLIDAEGKYKIVDEK